MKRKTDRLLLAAVLLIFAALGLYAPWVYVDYEGHLQGPAPRDLIFAPSMKTHIRLDTSRLAVEWIVVAVLGAALYVVTRSNGKGNP